MFSAKRASPAALALVAWLTAAPVARAQGNYRSSPIGGRTMLVGGTGVTYSNDGSSAFLNPATAVRVDDQRLTFAVNFYSLSVSHAPRWYQPGSVDRAVFGNVGKDSATLTSFEFDALPSSLCLFLRIKAPTKIDPELASKIGDARFGFCFATVAREEFDFSSEGHERRDASGFTRQVQTVSRSFGRFALGPTLAMQLNERWAVGASAHATLTNHRSILTSTASTFRTTGTPISSIYYGASRGAAFGVDAVLGATYRIGRQSVGIAVETPSLHIFGVSGASRHVQFEGAGSATDVESLSGSFASYTPWRLSMGTGIEARWGSAEFDVSYYAPMRRAFAADMTGRTVRLRAPNVTDDPNDVSLSSPAEGVVNFAAGGEYFLSPRISLLGGLSTDLSAASRASMIANAFNYYAARSERVAASFGVGSHGGGGDLLAGVELSYAWGDRLLVNSYAVPPQPTTTRHDTATIVFVIAGSTSLQMIKRAVRDVKDVLDPKKTPKPATPATDKP